jgi:hypothetical protein
MAFEGRPGSSGDAPCAGLQSDSFCARRADRSPAHRRRQTDLPRVPVGRLASAARAASSHASMVRGSGTTSRSTSRNVIASLSRSSGPQPLTSSSEKSPKHVTEFLTQDTSSWQVLLHTVQRLLPTAASSRREILRRRRIETVTEPRAELVGTRASTTAYLKRCENYEGSTGGASHQCRTRT